MSKDFGLTITTPERTVFEGRAESVTIPTSTGEITVLAHHMPIATVLKAGELVIRHGQDVQPYAVAGGFVEVLPDKIVILADTAEHLTEIDEQRAQEAVARAEKLKDDVRHNVEEYAMVTAKLERDLNRLKIIRKHRSRHMAHVSNLPEQQ